MSLSILAAKTAFVLIYLMVATVVCEKVRYDNYRVYSLKVDTPAQLSILQHLESVSNGTIFLDGPILSQNATLVVPPHKLADIAELLSEHRIENEVQWENLQSLIDGEQPLATNKSNRFDWNAYHNLETIYEWLDEQLDSFPNILTGYIIGKSFEGRPIRAVKLSHKSGNPTIFIESTIHAREWVTVTAATHLLNNLLTSNDSSIVNMAQNFDWVIVPVLNVDGYVFSHTTNRLWRKTRSRYFSECIGVDPNRNFDVNFGGIGSSINACTETYSGPHAFSEPETAALSNFVDKFDIKLYLSFHMFGQMLIFPYGYRRDRSAHFDHLMQIGRKTVQAISQRYGTRYVLGSIANIISPISGSSIDWTYVTKNISLSYVFEFRDRGRFRFLLPARYIIPNAEEVTDGIRAMIEQSQALHYL